jgi:hypothetical protein
VQNLIPLWDIQVNRCARLLTTGAIRSGPFVDDSTARKITTFRKAGIKVLDHIGYIGTEMRDLLREFKSKGNETNTPAP